MARSAMEVSGDALPLAARVPAEAGRPVKVASHLPM